MGVTGWIGEGPEEAPRLPVTEMLLAGSRGGPQPGAVLAQSLARARAAEAREAREREASARDPDEYAAGLVARGYRPGLVSQLSMQLGDVMAELADEEAKLEKAAKRSEHLRRSHEAGRITVFDMARSLGEDDDGDEGRVRMLTRRAESLRRQIGEAQEAISPPQRYESDDGVEAATRRAHEAFRQVTRAKLAEAQSGTAARPEPRPFGSVSRGRSTEHVPGGDCWVCAEGRRRDAAGRDQSTPYSEFAGPAITRNVGYNDAGELGNYSPVVSR